MVDFRKVSDSFLASPQISIEDVAIAKAQGVSVIVNNRPDGEEPSAPQSEEIALAAQSAGLQYVAIPVGRSGFSEVQVDELIGVLEAADGPALGYCRTGTRSTLLWALAQAKTGASPEDIAKLAMAAGYDVSPVRPMLDMFAARHDTN